MLLTDLLCSTEYRLDTTHSDKIQNLSDRSAYVGALITIQYLSRKLNTPLSDDIEVTDLMRVLNITDYAIVPKVKAYTGDTQRLS